MLSLIQGQKGVSKDIHNVTYTLEYDSVLQNTHTHIMCYYSKELDPKFNKKEEAFDVP